MTAVGLVAWLVIPVLLLFIGYVLRALHTDPDFRRDLLGKSRGEGLGITVQGAAFLVLILMFVGAVVYLIPLVLEAEQRIDDGALRIRADSILDARAAYILESLPPEQVTIPVGAVVAWDPRVRDALGSPTDERRPIPAGWAVCPDLEGRYLLGGSVESAGTLFGSPQQGGTIPTGPGGTPRSRERGDTDGDVSGQSHTHSLAIPAQRLVFLCRAR